MTQRLNKLDEALEAPPPSSGGGRGWLWPVLLLLLATAGVGGYFLFNQKVDDLAGKLEFAPVERGSILFTIVEKGELEAARNTDVNCRVRASGRGNAVASTIKWVIDNGSKVKRGDLLMLLDDSGIKDQIKNQEIVIAGAQDTKIQAESNLEIVRSENESALKTAQNNVELARLDLDKYVKGELEKLRKDVTGRITLKESELLQSRDRVGWSSRMVKKGYISESQARGDELKLRSSEIELDKLQEESRVLNEYDAQRNRIDFQNKLEQAIVAEKVARTQAIAKEAQAMAKLQSATAVLNQEEAKLEDLREDLRNCRILAPNDGMVVYYIPESSRFGQSTQQGTIAVGEGVREGQKLMRIPDLSSMLVRAKVHESLVPRLKGDILQDSGFSEALQAVVLANLPQWDAAVRVLWYPRLLEQYAELDEEVAEFGLPATIRVASLANPLNGHLRSVDPVASSTDWMSSDVKVYPSLVAIDDAVEGLKPGMSAEVTIMVDERTNVLKLPVQAVIEAGGSRFCYVREPSGEIVKRELQIGLNNNKFLEVLPDSKLKEGEMVLLNARTYAEKQGDLQSAGGEQGESMAGKQQKGRGLRKNGTSPAATRPAASAPAAAAPTGTRPQMTEERRKQMQEFNDKMQKASPAERKKMIDALPMPDEVKGRIRQRYRDQGLQIDD